MTILKRTAFALLAFSLTAPAAAQTSDGPEFIERTSLLSETSAPLTREEAAALLPRPEGQKFVVAAGIIILAGAAAWGVITDNRPSADLNTSYASAIPGFNFNWNSLDGWKKVTRKYRFTVDHWLQGRAVDITYEVSFNYGAIPLPGAKGLHNGHYITNFVVKPEAIDLKWGWKVSLNAAMSDPMNIGSSDNPVAALLADLRWQYSKPLTTKPNLGVTTISVDGLGSLKEQNYSELNISPVGDDKSPKELPSIIWD